MTSSHAFFGVRSSRCLTVSVGHRTWRVPADPATRHEMLLGFAVGFTAKLEQWLQQGGISIPSFLEFDGQVLGAFWLRLGTDGDRQHVVCLGWTMT